MKKVGVALCVLTVLLFTGCASLQEEDVMVANIKECIPEAEYMEAQPIESSEDYESGNKYYFKGKDFDFYVLDYIYSNPGGFLSNNQETNYYLQVLSLKKDEIDNLVSQYDFEITIENNWSGDIDIECTINSFNDIKSSFAFFIKFYDIIKAYMPQKASDLFPQKCYYTIYIVSNQYEKILYNGNFDLTQGVFKIQKENAATAEEKYVDKVRNKEVIDYSVGSKHFEKYKPLALDSIYINGERFNGEKEDNNLRIYFNIMDGNYYISVGYGIDVDYNGGVEDGINREIIKKYYPNSKYTISNAGGYSKYTINGDKYEITRNNKTDDMRFYKNGKEMNIKDYDEVSGCSSGANYFRLIKTEDFAELTGLNYVKVDCDAKIIYFETK